MVANLLSALSKRPFVSMGVIGAGNAKPNHGVVFYGYGFIFHIFRFYIGCTNDVNIKVSIYIINLHINYSASPAS